MSAGRQKVFVGMSGGVDSSVSAALLLEQGYEVVGVFIKVWQADFLPCTWREERREAMRAAAHLGIPFLTLDLEKAYKTEVVDYMIREYGKGRVPNPDVMCNKHVKFGAFLDFATTHGAEYVATGHYARIESGDTSHKSQANSKHNAAKSDLKLLKGVDDEKDQSYFLWTLTQEQLARTLFPVGHLHKVEVRALAKKFELPNADKKDSQGLCFMGAVDMREFLSHYLETTTGNVLDISGNCIGTHDGAMLYTIGQRHGFHTAKTTSAARPLFVLSKNIEANTITVGERGDTIALGAKSITIASLHDPSGILQRASDTDAQFTACIRYRGELFNARIAQVSGDQATVLFAVPVEDVALGQSVVIYQEDVCVGGGIVTHIT